MIDITKELNIGEFKEHFSNLNDISDDWTESTMLYNLLYRVVMLIRLMNANAPDAIVQYQIELIEKRLNYLKRESINDKIKKEEK